MLKRTNRKYWTNNFELSYPCFRYATCYAKGIYTMGHKPLCLQLHSYPTNGTKELSLARYGVGHTVQWDTGNINAETRAYFNRVVNLYAGLTAGKFHCYVYKEWCEHLQLKLFKDE